VGWPPKVGELLPRAGEATGVRRKLASYSLEPRHPRGGSKAVGFALILGITSRALDYLEVEIYAGILDAPITSIRDNPPYGVSCVVEFPLRGVGDHQNRVANLRTVWELLGAGSCPRLVSAFLKD
jgi:hypothetical protein